MSRMDDLLRQNEELRLRLAEAEDALSAIRGGEVDAIVVEGAGGAQVFSLAGAEKIYRVLVETMYEAGLTTDLEGNILFCNRRFCELLRTDPSAVLGQPLASFVSVEHREALTFLLLQARKGAVQQRLVLNASDGTQVPVQAAANLLDVEDNAALCVVAADLTDLEASYLAIRTLEDHQKEMEEANEALRRSRAAALSLTEDATLAREEAERAGEALRQSEERYRRLAEENERLYHQQLDIADNLQLALLNIPSVMGPVKIGHLYRSATEAARVGGDFYDAFPAKDGNMAMLVGDVSGHGIEAARTATLVRDVIHAFTHQSVRPHEVLRRTNGLLVEKALRGFVTVFLGVLELESGLFRYASAGHPETLLRRASGEVEALDSGSYPLGIFPEAFWKPGIVQLSSGDLLLLYTDGITEARRNKEFFGRERVEEILKRKGVSARRLPQMVLDRVMAFSEGRLSDDVALLALSLEHDPEKPRVGRTF